MVVGVKSDPDSLLRSGGSRNSQARDLNGEHISYDKQPASQTQVIITTPVCAVWLSTGLLSTNHTAVAKHLGCSQTRLLVTHYLDIQRQTAQRCANVDAIRLRKHLRGYHANPRSPPSPLLLISPLSPSINTMSPPPLGNFPFGELTATGKLALYSVTVIAVAPTKQFAYLLKYYRN